MKYYIKTFPGISRRVALIKVDEKEDRSWLIASYEKDIGWLKHHTMHCDCASLENFAGDTYRPASQEEVTAILLSASQI